MVRSYFEALRPYPLQCQQRNLPSIQPNSDSCFVIRAGAGAAYIKYLEKTVFETNRQVPAHNPLLLEAPKLPQVHLDSTINKKIPLLISPAKRLAAGKKRTTGLFSHVKENFFINYSAKEAENKQRQSSR